MGIKPASGRYWTAKITPGDKERVCPRCHRPMAMSGTARGPVGHDGNLAQYHYACQGCTFSGWFDDEMTPIERLIEGVSGAEPSF